MKLRGHRIELSEIEILLAQHPLIRAAVVVLHEKEAHLVAYLVPALKQEKPSVPELRTFLKERLPEYMLPSAFVLLDALPFFERVDAYILPGQTCQINFRPVMLLNVAAECGRYFESPFAINARRVITS